MKKALTALVAILVIGVSSVGINFPENYKRAARATGEVFYCLYGKDILGRDYKHSPRASCVFFEKSRCFTNAHLFLGKPIGEIVVRIYHQDQKLQFKAGIDYWDGLLDLVVLKIEGEIPFEPITLADYCEVGEDIMFGGYGSFPFPKLRFGKLNYDPKYGIYVKDIYYGDSGSGIFNMNGELLGIIYALWEWNEGQKKPSTMRGYAIPVEVIKEFLKS